MAILVYAVGTTSAQPSKLATPTLAIRQPSLVTLVITRPTLTSTTVISLGNDEPAPTTAIPLAETSTSAEPAPAEGSDGISTTGVVILGLIIHATHAVELAVLVDIAVIAASKDCLELGSRGHQVLKVSEVVQVLKVIQAFQVSQGYQAPKAIKASKLEANPVHRALPVPLVNPDRRGRKDVLGLLVQTDRKASPDPQEKTAEMEKMASLESTVDQGRQDVTAHRVRRGFKGYQGCKGYPDRLGRLDRLDRLGPRGPRDLKDQMALVALVVCLVQEVPAVAEKRAVQDLGIQPQLLPHCRSQGRLF
ncbi:hypothetical protein PG991_010016 [Apiospora marii]|uniref:Uncharacterized protein n=1 Tax=Apiospora marii TaxID=335849 RepID=A0ABR1RH93_9PEZI